MVISRKWLGVLLALLLALGIAIAGCSKGGTPQATSDGGSSPKPTAYVKKDISVSIYDRGNVPKEEGTIDNNRWTKWINEHGPANVKFIPIPRNNSVQKFNTLFASGSAPDLVLEYDAGLRNQLYNQKMLMPLDDLIEKYSTVYKETLKKYPALKKVTTMPDGKIYTFGRVTPFSPLSGMYIRTDWLKKLNLSVPRTTEELYTVLKAFVENDPDGNGKKDTLGMDAAVISLQLLNRMFGNVGWIVNDGKLVYDWERQKAANAFIKRLYDEGIIDKDYLTRKGAGPFNLDTEGIIANKIGVWGTYAVNGGSGPGQDVIKALLKSNPSAEVALIALPKSPFGQFSPTVQNPVQVTGMVNANTKNPEAVIKYVDFIASTETTTTLSYGIQGEDWKSDQDGCPNRIDPKSTKNSYIGDVTMLFSGINFGVKCISPYRINTGDPNMDKLFKELTKQAYEAYIDPKRPPAEYTLGENAPALPSDLQQIGANVGKTVQDIWAKATVSGSSYTIEQAMSDAKSAWDKAGAKKLEEWYAKWYEENKDKAFLTKDLYDFIVKH